MTKKKGSVTAAAQALFLTPQTITGQIRQFEERIGGQLFKRNGRGIEPTELGQLVYRYADKMFDWSYEMLDVINYKKDDDSSFNVGIADALSKGIASKILIAALPKDSSVHLRCFESTHELLLNQLSEHKLDVILSDCPINSSQHPGLLSKKLGECGVSFFSCTPKPKLPFPQCLMERKMLIPAKQSSLGRQLARWLEEKALTPTIFGEFDDAALLKAFGLANMGIFVASSLHQADFLDGNSILLIGETEDLKEEYYAIFAERMIQHPAVKRLCEYSFDNFFSGLDL